MCMSSEEKVRSQALDRLIKREFRQEQEIIKLLLLGTGSPTLPPVQMDSSMRFPTREY